ncbi:MAG: TlpA disulfide reductase family protein [Pseudomonadota bacterium]
MHRRAFLLASLAAAAAPAARAARARQGLFIHETPVPLPALSVKDGDGRPVELQYPLVLNLWASWCLPCVAELPALDRLKPWADARGVAVVALSLDRAGAAAVRPAYGRIGVTNLAVHTDDTRLAAETLKAPVLPVTVLVDRQGREAARYVGPAAWDQARDLVTALAEGRPITAAMAPPPAKHTGAAP